TISAFQEVLNEQSSAVSNYQKPFSGPTSNTYNPGWRIHPNFSWRNGQSATPQGFLNQIPIQEKPQEDLVLKHFQKQELFNHGML
ncbi:hypothetical protein PJP08_29350, partial [Mycobacterium kansasii]